MTLNLPWLAGLILLGLVAVERAQAEPNPKQGIGLQLSVTAEPFAAGLNRWELNITPVIFHHRLTEQWGIKLMPLLNLRMQQGASPTLSHLGFSVSAPGFIRAEAGVPQGFYLGPLLGYSYNLADQDHNLTLAAEVGYAFSLQSDLALTLSGELGATWFSQDPSADAQPGTSSWQPHLGIKPQLTWWY